MDINERIAQQLRDQRIVLFMKGDPQFPMCGFSARTAAALEEVGASFAHVNILQDPELREALKAYSGWPTYPQLYVAGELVGGHDIVMELYHSGELANRVRSSAQTAENQG